MKLFIFKIIPYLIVITILYATIGRWIADKPLHLAGFEVFHSANKAKRKADAKIVILGDSVARQLYNNYVYNNSIYSLASNQVITMAGQYFLLHDFLTNNVDAPPEKAILLIHPFSFANNIDNNCYQYFLKPLYTREHQKLCNNYLKQRINTVPFSKISQFPIIKYCNFAPTCDNKFENSSFISQISIDYLDSIRIKCFENDIRFQLISVPVNIIHRTSVESIRNNCDGIKDELLYNYFENIQYYSSENFTDDIHFIEDCIPFDFLHLLDK